MELAGRPSSFPVTRWISRRAAGIELEAAIVTNITQDHFDYHRGFEPYREAKARILELVRPGGLIALNMDDAGSWSLRQQVHDSVSFVSFGLKPGADISAQILEESLEGTRFRLSLHGRSFDCATTMIGRHNISNCLGATPRSRRICAWLQKKSSRGSSSLIASLVAWSASNAASRMRCSSITLTRTMPCAAACKACEI